MMPGSNLALLTGKDSSDIDFKTLGVGLHGEVVEPFIRLQQRAALAGFELTIASSYRDYERQLLIWNEKACGQRPVRDSQSCLLDINTLSKRELMMAILRWSALPGASRHHWGTDIDVFDRAAVADDYQLQFTTQEFDVGGPFYPFHKWLEQEIKRDDCEGFFRPYDIDRSGIAPERWHLSYAPLADKFCRQLNLELLRESLDERLLLGDVVLEHLDEIFERFISVPVCKK